MTPGWKCGGWKTEREGRGAGASERGNKRARSPLHCVTKRATRPTKSLSTLMRVPRCVKIPRRRNNIGRSRCFAIRPPPPSPPSAPIRGRIVVRFFYFPFLFTTVIFLYFRPAIHRRCRGVLFCARRARSIGIEAGNVIDSGEGLSAKFYHFDKPRSVGSPRFALTV